MSRTFIMAGQRGASELGFSPTRLARLVEVLESEIERERLPGAVALIARHGKLVLCESLGWQDPGTAAQMGQVEGKAHVYLKLEKMGVELPDRAEMATRAAAPKPNGGDFVRSPSREAQAFVRLLGP